MRSENNTDLRKGYGVLTGILKQRMNCVLYEQAVFHVINLYLLVVLIGITLRAYENEILYLFFFFSYLNKENDQNVGKTSKEKATHILVNAWA